MTPPVEIADVVAAAVLATAGKARKRERRLTSAIGGLP